MSVLLHSSPTDAAQQVPYKINFQGRLTDNSGNVLADGLYNVKFRLWTLASGGSNVWEEDRVITGTDNRVQVTNGLFNIQFGDLTTLSPALFVTGTGSLYLEVELPTPATATCATNGCAVFTEGAMTPRQTLASSPYAMNSDTLDGLDSSAFGQLSATNTFTGANLFAPITSSTVALTVKATTAGSTNGLEVFDSSGTRRAFFDANGAFSTTALNAPSAGGTITTNAATLQRTASGVLTLDLSDSATTTLTVTNSGAGTADLNLAEGALQTAGTTRLTNAGALQNITDISQTGTYLLQNTADSITAFQILTSGGSPRTVVNVDTTNTSATLDANLIVNSTVSLPGITSAAFSSNSAGSLSGAAGTNYFYRISAIVGSETAASGEVWINSSAFTPLSAPSAPSVAAGTSGGISGTYQYKYTYITANGETTPSTASSSLAVSNKKIVVTIANGPTGTTGKKIYRTIAGPGPSYLLVTTIADNTTTSYTDSTADGSLGVAAPGSNTATTNLNSVSVTFPAFPSATSYQIYRGTSSRGEDHYQTAASSPFTDTGSAGTAATPIEPTAGRVGIGQTSPGYALDVAGNVNASNAYVQNGNVGQTASCGAGSIFSGLSVSGGIITASGSCASIGGGSASATLQSAYDNSSIPQIALSSGGGALTVSDTSGGLGTDLLDVQNNGGTTTYLGVSATGISVTGSGTFTAGVNISTGQTYNINGTQISTSALSDVASITMQGNTFNGASGLVQLNGSTQLPAVSGTNLTNLNPTNLATGSGAVTLASTTGALTLTSGSGTIALGSSTIQRSASGLTLDVLNAAGASTLTITNSDVTNIANLSVEGGVTVGSGKTYSVGATAGISRSCLTSEYLDIINFVGGILSAGTCTILPGGAGGANTTLSNLGTTAINAALIPDATANNRDLGTSGSLWRTGYFGTSVVSSSFTGTGAVTLSSAAASTLTLDSGTTGSILIGADTSNAKTISVGPTATNTNTTTLNLAVNTAGTQTISIGSAGAGNAAAGTTLNLQGGTTAGTAITLGTNGAGGITIDTGTTGSILIGNGANAKSTTLGSTNTSSTTNIVGGTSGSINIGSVGTSTLSSTTNIANTSNATGTQSVGIGSNANAVNTVDIDGGTGATGIEIGDTTSAHGIKIGAGGAAAGNAQTIAIGSGTTSTASTVTLQGGNITTTNGNSGVIIGGGFSTSDTNLVGLTLDSSSTFAEVASTCTATVNGGALYYNSTSDSVRVCMTDSPAVTKWEDVTTTADLGLLLFGVVPDTGTVPGDWIGINGVNPSTGPCKVYMGSTTSTVRWTGCTAYSGGRKVIIAAQPADQAVTTGSGVWAHVCLTGTNNQPALTTGAGVTETNNLPAFSASAPVLCLADISTTNTAGGHIVEIYDTRTFTTTTKEIVNNITTAPGLGMVAQQTLTAGSVTRPAATAALTALRGVFVSTDGTTTANAMNSIIATAGPAYVKSTAGSVQSFVQTGAGTAGYAVTAANVTTGYSTLGIALSAFSSTCGANADNCRGSIAVNLSVK